MKRTVLNRPKQPIFVLVVVLLALTGAASPALAQQSNDPLEIEARVGFDGYIQQDVYYPITVTASNNGDDITVDLRVQSGVTGHSYSRTVDLPRGSRKQVTFYGSGMTLSDDVLIDVVDPRGRVLQTLRKKVVLVDARTLLIGVWSDTPQSLAALAAVEPSSGDTVVALLTADDLPDVAEGWRALDVLVISDADTGTLSDAQREALRGWLTQGGRLIIVGGISYTRTLAGLDGFSPVLANDSATLSVRPLEDLSRRDFDVQADFEAPVAVGPVVADADVLVASENAALVVGQQVGYGRVDFLAADPGLEPLRSWEGMPDVWRGILLAGRPRPGWAYGFNSNDEFAREAAASIPGIRLPSILQLCGFLSLYTILIGPVNYLVLRRMKRRELAWLSIPVLVIAFSLIAYITGFQLRGSRAILHEVSVVHIPAGSDLAHVDGMLGVWSPRRARYDLQLPAGMLGRSMTRDMGGPFTAVNAVDATYDEVATLEDVRVDVGSVQTFYVEGSIPAPIQLVGEVTRRGSASNLSVSGEIINNSAIDLTDVMVVMGQTVEPIGDVPAGEVAAIDMVVRFGSQLDSPLDPFPNQQQYGGYYGYGFSALVEEVTEAACYQGGRSEFRCNQLASVINSDSRGLAAYLIGWSDGAAFDVNVLNAASGAESSTVYIIEIPLTTDGEISTNEILPGEMTWEVLEMSDESYFGSPNDFYLGSTSPLIVRFEPYTGQGLDDYRTMIIHLDPYYEEVEYPILEVWNLDTDEWDAFVITDWEAVYIDDPDAYVDGQGGVEISLRARNEFDYVGFEAFEVTLIGEPDEQ